jgi:hypothetical protein
MPRKKITGDTRSPSTRGELVEKLAKELKSAGQSGQPMIYEQEYSTGKMSVTVARDAWDHMPLDQRTSTILRAYEVAEGDEFRNRIALASGLTLPEAHTAGMLAYEIIPAFRASDPVPPERVRQAMLEEGASVLVDPSQPQLRFGTEQEASACRQRLIERLPASEPIWLIHRQVFDSDSFGVQERERISGS